MIKTLTKETIAVHWKEEELICPNEEFVRQANMSDLRGYAPRNDK